MAKYWIKLYHEILDDPKMGRLPDRLYRRVIELFLLAGETDEGGILPDIDDMAWKLRLSPDELTAELQAIEQATNIVHLNGNGWTVTKFAERQDADTGAERVKRYRTAQRKEAQTVTNSYTPVTNDVTNTVQELELESELKLKLELELDTYIQACETATGYPIQGTPDDLAALKEMARIGATAEDISDAVAFFVSKGKVARGPSQLLASVKTAHAKRIQSTAQPIPVREPYASETYG